MSINGTNFRIPQTGEAKRGNWFASHKYSFKSALRYEIGVSIMGGPVMDQGPYPAGRFNVIAIFNKVLRHFLEPGERVEAYNGYVGAADKIKCARTIRVTWWKIRGCSPEQGINGRFKIRGILKHTYHHDIRRHGEVFQAIATMTRLAVSNGSPLFSVEYED
jgi:hypothetical protein